MNKKLIKIRFFVEYIIVKFLFIILSVLPINIVSNLGGNILKFLGPFSKQHTTAVKNYKRIFPNHSKKIRNKNISKVPWKFERDAKASACSEFIDANVWKSIG